MPYSFLMAPQLARAVVQGSEEALCLCGSCKICTRQLRCEAYATHLSIAPECDPALSGPCTVSRSSSSDGVEIPEFLTIDQRLDHLWGHYFCEHGDDLQHPALLLALPHGWRHVVPVAMSEHHGVFFLDLRRAWHDSQHSWHLDVFDDQHAFAHELLLGQPNIAYEVSAVLCQYLQHIWPFLRFCILQDLPRDVFFRLRKTFEGLPCTDYAHGKVSFLDSMRIGRCRSDVNVQDLPHATCVESQVFVRDFWQA